MTGKLNIDTFKPCSANAVCMASDKGEPQCLCKIDYIGDGYICEKKPDTKAQMIIEESE